MGAFLSDRHYNLSDKKGKPGQTLSDFGVNFHVVLPVGDGALNVGDGHDSMLIERKLLVSQFFERCFGGGEALLHGFFGVLAIGNVSRNF